MSGIAWSGAQSGLLDHHELQLAAFNGFRLESVPSHLFESRPIREKVLVRLCFRRKRRLQQAPLPRVSISYLKRYGLGSLLDFLLARLGKLAHTLLLIKIFSLVADEVG
jgi:hypothetical protein